MCTLNSGNQTPISSFQTSSFCSPSILCLSFWQTPSSSAQKLESFKTPFTIRFNLQYSLLFDSISLNIPRICRIIALITTLRHHNLRFSYVDNYLLIVLSASVLLSTQFIFSPAIREISVKPKYQPFAHFPKRIWWFCTSTLTGHGRPAETWPVPIPPAQRGLLFSVIGTLALLHCLQFPEALSCFMSLSLYADFLLDCFVCFFFLSSSIFLLLLPDLAHLIPLFILGNCSLPFQEVLFIPLICM